jgi:hypothetical protein
MYVERSWFRVCSSRVIGLPIHFDVCIHRSKFACFGFSEIIGAPLLCQIVSISNLHLTIVGH